MSADGAGAAPVAAVDDYVRRRLALRSNPLAIIAKALAWRSVLYCLTSIVTGVVALIAGIVGFVALPIVARRTARAERSRVRILGLPRLDEANTADAGGRGMWTSGIGGNVAVWGSTVLFGLVDTIVGVPLFAVIVMLAVGLVGDITARNVLLTIAWIAVMWGVITLSLHIAWALASSQARVVHRVLTSQSDLAKRVADLASSRSELVDVFETERRRIERDLHDGAQQHLVVSTMRLGEAVYWLDEGRAGDARAAVLTAQESIEDALAALRDTIRGLHPQVLAERGLVAAVREVAARQPLDVTFAVEGEPHTLPPAVEDAAYHIVTEALTNVAKHAQAASAAVTLAYGDSLVVTVADDGAGGAHAVPGHGLSGLTERMDAANGTLDVVSPEGGPTRIVATFATD